MNKKSMLLFLTAVVCLTGYAFLSIGTGMAGDQADVTARILLGIALLCAAVFFVIAPDRRGAYAMSENSAPSVCEAPEVTFSDVAANEEARNSLEELSDYMKNPEKYEKLGARMPRGILLYGPPGTGKTLLARALAGEAGVPFYALSGSDFVEMYVGVGASRVRALFQKARKAGKCVIFIDEIDAMGKRRDRNANDEREQTLNALLSEMNGFHPCPGTLVLAATNRIDTLDPALLRPGRFDRQIEVGLPCLEQRRDILKLHAKGKPLDDNVDMERLAGKTVSFSGASLESLMNEAAIRAARRGAERIEQQDVDYAFVKGIAGEEKRSVSDKKELSVIAVHEAGHALATRKLLPENVIERVTILPSGKGAAGYNLSIPRETALTDRIRLKCQIQVLLAGRAAEILAGGEDKATSGAANDLTRAADIACAMVMDLAMEGAPFASLRQIQNRTGGSGNGMERVCTLLEAEYQAVSKLLAENLDDLMKITEALLRRETLTGDEIDAILSGSR